MKKRGKKRRGRLSTKKKIVAVYLILGFFLIGLVIFAGIKPFLINLLGAVATELKSTDLSSYPEMFVSKGKFNGYLVVGEKAQMIDSLALTDIASSMKIKVAAATNNSLSGDFWKVGNSAKLEMANSDASTGSIQGENLRDILNYIGAEKLGALADGIYKTGESRHPFKQYLYFDVSNTGTNELVKYAENDNETADVFFYVGSGNNIGQYKLEFTPSAKSSIYDATGAASSTGMVLKQFEDTKITLLGEKFTIVLARRAQQNSIKLTLMGGAANGSLVEGETQTYRLNGDDYTISLTYVDGTYAKFLVNGELTDTLQVGDVYKLADGKEIGVSELMYQSYAGGAHSADFFVGADKMILRDDDVTDTESDNELDVGGKTIGGADVIITGTDDNTFFAMSTIVVNMTAQDDYYLGANDNLSSVIKSAGDDPEILFTNNWNIVFKGLSEAKSHEIKLNPSGDRKYKYIFYDGNGDKVDLPVFYAVNSTSISFSEEAAENCLILKKGVPIYKDDYFVVTGGDAGSGSAKSFALQYKGADKSTATSPKIKFKNLGSGTTLEYSIDISSTEAGSAVCDIKIGGYTFSVVSNQAETNNDFQISVSGTEDVDVVDYYGAQADFSNIPTSNCRTVSITSSAITIATADSSDYDSQAPAELVLTVGATATNKVTVSSFTIGGASNPLIGTGGVAYGYTSMGGKITYTSPSGSPNSFTYDYPKEQRLPLLYVTSGATSSVKSGDFAAVTVVDATKLDSEIASVAAQNLIVVGGPCVNTAAAELLGKPVDCTDGLTPGKARIKLLKNGNNWAMVVAGYGSVETRLAGEVLAHRWTELSGSEVEIEGTDYDDAVIKVIR